MPETILREGKLRFEFAEKYQVTQYDQWKFYRNQFVNISKSVKAVDFLCTDGNTLWLIEVKDYRTHKRKNENPLEDEVALKVKDTLAGLFAASLNADEPGEKEFAKQVLTVRKLCVVLHLEGKNETRAHHRKGRFASMSDKLKKRLRSVDPRPQVANHQTQQNGWRVIPEPQSE